MEDYHVCLVFVANGRTISKNMNSKLSSCSGMVHHCLCIVTLVFGFQHFGCRRWNYCSQEEPHWLGNFGIVYFLMLRTDCTSSMHAVVQFSAILPLAL